MMTISEAQRDKSYKELEAFDASLKLSRKYSLCSNYYFQEYRMKTRKKGKLSVYDVINSPSEMKKVRELLKKKNIEHTRANAFRIIKLWYGCAGQFRPDVAVYLYKKYSSKNVLDPFAGWGDRCVAAMSQRINYTGIDSNASLKDPYELMISHFNNGSIINMIFERSECIDFSKFEYDTILTSPPYYNVEKYEGMEYTNSSFEEAFKTIISRCYAHLKEDGYMILNMPEKMKNLLEIPIYEIIEMPISNRNYTSNSQKFECIYIYKKN